MRNLVRRYVTQEQRKAENEGVTEDDVNEIKNDISAFRQDTGLFSYRPNMTKHIFTHCRFELIEIMRMSGMKVNSGAGHGMK